MNRKAVYQKMLKYNPKWFKVLMPYYDGITELLPDDQNLELEFKDLNIEHYSSCIVGETHNFSCEYMHNEKPCYICVEFAKALDYWYNVDKQERFKQNSDILSTFKDYLGKFYNHLDKVKK